MEEIKPTRVFLYARVSMDEGGSREQDPEMQLIPLRAHYAARGLPIAEEFVDKESGASTLRTGFRRLLNTARMQGDEIGVFKLDRFARFQAWESVALAMGLGRKGVRLFSLNDPTTNNIDPTPFEGIMLYLSFWAAEVERWNTIRRTKNAASVKKEQGKSVGGRPKGSHDVKQRVRRWKVAPQFSMEQLLRGNP